MTADDINGIFFHIVLSRTGVLRFIRQCMFINDKGSVGHIKKRKPNVGTTNVLFYNNYY